MAAPATVLVTGPGSLRGTVDTTAWPLESGPAQIVVRLEDGTSALVPREALIRQADGSYHLILDPDTLARRDASGEVREPPLVVPVIEEVLDVQTRAVERGRVRVSTIVREHEEVVDPPLLRDEVLIERVPINRVVEGPMSARSEGDTLIIPVLEEVLVVEKRFLLKEEVRVTTRRVETHSPRRMTLRRQEAIVERINPEGNDSNPCT